MRIFTYSIRLGQAEFPGPKSLTQPFTVLLFLRDTSNLLNHMESWALLPLNAVRGRWITSGSRIQSIRTESCLGSLATYRERERTLLQLWIVFIRARCSWGFVMEICGAAIWGQQLSNRSL